MANLVPISLSTLISPSLRTTSDTIGVNREFRPVGFTQPGIAKWVDRSGGIQAGYPTLTLSVRQPTKDGQVTRTTVKLVSPTLEPESAGTSLRTKAYDLIANIEFVINNRSSRAEREAFLSQVISLLAVTITASDDDPLNLTESPVVPAVLDYEAPY